MCAWSPGVEYRIGGVSDRPHSGHGVRLRRHRGVALTHPRFAKARDRAIGVVEATVPKGLSIHVILDNYGTHKTPEVDRWLKRHPRVHFHCTPTSASWLNLVERFFSELTTRQLRRLAVTSVLELETAIDTYLAQRNATPTPFTWTASVRKILAKVKKAKDTLASLH
ncbi:MAG: transposase [Gemmatimonadota bacterium]